MKKIICLLMFASASASAYDYKHVDPNIEIIGRMVSAISHDMIYNANGPRVQEMSSKRDLAACVVDNMVGEAIEIFGENSRELNPYIIDSYLTIIKYMALVPSARDRYMRHSDILWVLSLEYKCIDYHVDRQFVLSNKARADANSYYEQHCKGDTQCFKDAVAKYRAQYGVE